MTEGDLKDLRTWKANLEELLKSYKEEQDKTLKTIHHIENTIRQIDEQLEAANEINSDNNKADGEIETIESEEIAERDNIVFLPARKVASLN